MQNCGGEEKEDETGEGTEAPELILTPGGKRSAAQVAQDNSAPEGVVKDAISHNPDDDKAQQAEIDQKIAELADKLDLLNKKTASEPSRNPRPKG